MSFLVAKKIILLESSNVYCTFLMRMTLIFGGKSCKTNMTLSIKQSAFTLLIKLFLRISNGAKSEPIKKCTSITIHL